MESFTLPAFIFGLTEMFKIIGISPRFLPFIAVLSGAILNPALAHQWSIENILSGAFVGMVVTGVINRTDSIIKEDKKDPIKNQLKKVKKRG